MRALRILLIALALVSGYTHRAHAVFGLPGPSQLILDLVSKFSGGEVTTQGVTGWPNALHVDRLELHDSQGVWLIAEDVTLDWHPYRLAFKDAEINKLTIGTLRIPRLMVSAPAPPGQAQKPSSGLPVTVEIGALQIDRVDLGAPVMGTAAALSLSGSLKLPSLEAPTAHLVAHRLDGGGDYKVDADVTAARIDATVSLSEPEHGLIATIAKLPEIGALRLDASVKGPRDALATQAALSAGQLTARVDGTVNLTGSALDVQVAANAPAMTPASGVSWQSVAVNAHVQGPFTKPNASGQAVIAQLSAAGASVQKLTADLNGNQGQVSVHATADGIVAPLPDRNLLASAPLVLDATAKLDDPARPVTFKLSHPLLTAQGTAKTAGAMSASVDLAVPQLAPLSALGGVDLQGSTTLHVDAGMADGTTRVSADGTLSLTGGPAPAPALIGEGAKIGLTAAMTGQDLSISRLVVNGKTVTINASGSRTNGQLAAHVEAALSQLSVVAPTLSGTVSTVADIAGQPSDLAVKAHVTGDIGAPGVKQGPVTADLDLRGLPSAPSGTINAQGQLAGAPLQLAVNAARDAGGAVTVKIDRADWRSVHADGSLRLPAGATLPLGDVSLRIAQLGDLRPFVGQPVTGGLTATVHIDPNEARIDARAHDAGIPGTRVGQATVTARVRDPLHAPVVTASAQVSGIASAGVTGSAKVDVAGPQSALAIMADASLDMKGTPARIATAATLDVPGKHVRVSRLEVAAKGQTARLLAPTTVSFGQTVSVDRLRVGVQQAVLDVAGELSPRLDATVSLHTPADVARIASPELALDGRIALDARLRGTPAAPEGTIRLEALGLRARTGPGRSVPPANLTATVALRGKSAQVNGRVSAGSAAFTVAGQAPLGAGALDLRVNGGLDLTLLDPILTAAGRRVRGRLTVDAVVAGTTSAPDIRGSARLARGEIQDFTQGVRITDISALVRGDGGNVRIVSFTGRAGEGTISASGTVGLTAPGMPVDIALRANNARPVTSDMLQIDLDANIALRGAVERELEASGKVLIRRAVIQIPSRLPARVQALAVIRPGDKKQTKPAGPAPQVRLNLVVDAPQQIFVRGRGVDAELSGALQIKGDASKPQVTGGFDMRRGDLSLAGTTLTFDRGKVSFAGTGPSGQIDPTLDFEATTTSNNVTATLTIGGFASAPTVKLTSVPQLPQDEILSYLLFRRSIKDVGPFQIAGIAASLAELTGVGGEGGNPLSQIQSGLGLDRLTVGGSGASGASVEAGRYVANGVYVGAKQGTGSGAGTGAVLQIDITKGLKVETDVGSGKGSNSVGVVYQFQY